MSPAERLQAVVWACLSCELPAELGASVFDAPPARSADPYVVVDEPMLTDWSTKTWAGREGRLAILSYDRGERPLRLRVLANAIEEALTAIGPDLGEGWRLAGLRLARSRLAQAAGGRWQGMSEFAVRLYRES